MTEGKNTDELKRKPYLILTEACVSNEASSGQSSKYKTSLSKAEGCSDLSPTGLSCFASSLLPTLVGGRQACPLLLLPPEVSLRGGRKLACAKLNASVLGAHMRSSDAKDEFSTKMSRSDEHPCGVGYIYITCTHSSCNFQILELGLRMKHPKDMLRGFQSDEIFEMWDSKKKEWIAIPIDPTDPDIGILKQYMLANLEVVFVRESINLGLKVDEDWN